MKELTQKQMAEMWGDGGPYSQVQLITEERLLEDFVSRTFIIVSVNINPFTFKYVKKNRKRFADSKIIHGLLQTSEYVGRTHGYSCYTFMSEYTDEEVFKAGKAALEVTRNAVLLMHRFVIDEFGLRHDKKSVGTIVDISESRKIH